MLYCIGDSHTSVFSGQDPMIPQYPTEHPNRLRWARAFRLGATTAWNFQKHVPLVKTLLREQKPRPGDGVMICAGEIDCRWHLIPQAQKRGLSRQAAAEECAERYVKALLQIRRFCAPRGLRLLAWGAIASSACRPPICQEYPAAGLCPERNAVTRFFNTRLAELCAGAGIGFASVFEKLVDGRDVTRMNYYMDMVHLSQKALPLVRAALRPLGVIGLTGAANRGTRRLSQVA